MRIGSCDEAICRCGFTVDHEVIVMARDRPDATPRLIASGRWTPIPKAEPGIRISESFAELSAVMWDPRLGAVGLCADGMVIAAEYEARRAGLVQQPGDAKGQYLCIEREPSGHGVGRSAVQLERHHLYAIAPFRSEVEAAGQMLRWIAAKHGPGRIWHTLAAVHYIADDGMMRVADVGGVPHVVLRSLYFHQPTCPLCSRPCDRLEVGGVKISGCPCVGSGDRAVAIDLSKLTKDPKSRGYSYSQYTPCIDRAAWMLRGVPPTAVDPLDVEYDGEKLLALLYKQAYNADERNDYGGPFRFTPLQRDAISAHWSAELRAKIAASKQKDRNQVTMEHDE